MPESKPKWARISRYSNHPDAKYIFSPCDPWAVGECQPFPTVDAARAHAEAKGYRILEVEP